VGGGFFGIGLERRAAIGGGAVGFALGIIRRSPVVARGGDLGIEPDRLAVVRDGAIEIAFGLVGEAAIIVATARSGLRRIVSSKSAMARSRSPVR
jgi:hypothetical protein